MKIIQSIMTKNPCYTAGKKITPRGLMLHSVGCAQPSAQVFINVWNTPSYGRACVHGFIDANTGDVYQTLPWNHRGLHGGGSSNDTHIGVEMCEPDCIKYVSGATFTCSDTARAKAMAQRTYDSAVQLFAHLCKQYNLNPLTDICSHAEGFKLGIASNHADPEHLWRQLGMGYTMDTFRKAVKNAMGNTTENKTLYRVQVGAFSNKANAEAMLAKVKAAGFDAFITSGENAVATKPETQTETTLKVGDKVKMENKAPIYGTSSTFAPYIYNSTLYVREIKGSRIVISTAKTGDITGAVDKKYLTRM